MRRVVSYNGASGVPASQRLKHKLSITAGMHLLYNDVKEEQQQGFLAPVFEPQQERIIHRTSWATRNFSSTKSVVKGFVNRRRDSFTSAERPTYEDGKEKGGEKQSDGGGGVPVQLLRAKIEGDKELVGSTTGSNLVCYDLGQRDQGSSFHKTPGKDVTDVGGDVLSTTSLSDLTNMPACAKTADSGGDASKDTLSSHLDGSHSKKFDINHSKGPMQEVFGSEIAHIVEPSVSYSSNEGQAETLALVEASVDRKSMQDLGSELPVCELTSVPGVGNDNSEALHTVVSGADVVEQDQVAELVEVNHDSEPSISPEPDNLEESESVGSNNAAGLRIQSYWRGWAQRRQYRLLKSTVAALEAESHRIQELERTQIIHVAAVVLQKHWRAVQSRLLLNHMKMERTVKDRAARVIQAHFRGHLSRCEIKKLSCAALTIQNCWHRYCTSRQALAAVRIQQVVRAHLAVKRRQAAVSLQAFVRGFVVRQKLVQLNKSATKIQQQWKAYNHRNMCVRAATMLQAHTRGFLVRRNYVLKKKAAVIIQACVRAHLVRCHLSVLHYAALVIQLQWRRYSLNSQAAAFLQTNLERESSALGDCLLQPALVPSVNYVKVETLSEVDLANRVDYVSPVKEDELEESPFTSSLENTVKVFDAASAQQMDYKAGDKGRGIVFSLRRAESGLRPLLDGENRALLAAETAVDKTCQEEDWNDVAIDHLDECLDTCLAALKPLPSEIAVSLIAAEQSFLDVDSHIDTHLSQKPSCSNQPRCSSAVEVTEPVKDAASSHAQDTSALLPTPRLLRTLSRKGVKHEISRDVSNTSANGILNQATLSSRDSPQPAHSSSAKLKNGSQSKTNNHKAQDGSNDEGKSRQNENSKRNEEKLQQFAQVFLLQRHIALQQQRAQSAPPFPPPTLAGSEFSNQSQVAQTRDVGTHAGTSERESSSVADRNWNDEANSHQAAASRHTKHNLIRDNEYCSEPSTPRQSSLNNQSDGGSFNRQSGTSGTDVVVDMVFLLRRIEEVYGTSDVEYGESSSACFPTRSGDIENGGAAVDREKKSSLSFPKSISMRHIGLPNVNAMLLVIIAMVVYTRTICRGVIFGTRQTQRKT